MIAMCMLVDSRGWDDVGRPGCQFIHVLYVMTANDVLLLLLGSGVGNCINSVASLDWSNLWLPTARSGGCACYQCLLLSDLWWQRQLGSHHWSHPERGQWWKDHFQLNFCVKQFILWQDRLILLLFTTYGTILLCFDWLIIDYWLLIIVSK